MTQVISRYFEDAAKARAAKRTLEHARFPREDLFVLSEPETLLKDLAERKVDPETAAAYHERLSKGGAVFVAKATFKPLGAAKLVRSITADMGASPMAGRIEEVYVKDRPGRVGSVYTDHPLFLSRRPGPPRENVHMADWPIPLISRRRPADAFAFPRHARMANFPIPLISRRKPADNFAFPRHARMASFPIPLLSKRKPYDKFAFPRHKRMADFPIPLISQRKPFTGSLFPRHQRMATVPFPLLINGKTGTNALIPGGPRMANFPIPLLSERKPSDKFAFPRHARMANWPIGLISKRKPFTGSAIERHGRMADAILPLIVKHAESKSAEGAKSFSFSSYFGWPTIRRR
jgi:hypothetical protein